VKSDMYKMWWN